MCVSRDLGRAFDPRRDPVLYELRICISINFPVPSSQHSGRSVSKNLLICVIPTWQRYIGAMMMTDDNDGCYCRSANLITSGFLGYASRRVREAS